MQTSQNHQTTNQQSIRSPTIKKQQETDSQ